METIHLKTVDPISQELLRKAEQKGVRLNWERYERLQPQDGFLRLGLSCPFGCMQGPCRIDPFGRGPAHGLCGLDRDGMVAALFLRLTLQGVMEITNGAVPELSADPNSVKSTIENLGGTFVSIREIYQSALMLQRPADPPETMIRQALRLGVLATLLQDRENTASKNLLCRAGYGQISRNIPTIGIAGGPPRERIEMLLKAGSEPAAYSAQLVSLGDWVALEDQFLPCVCTTGEAELLISSGRISLLMAGSKTDPGLVETCKAMDVPVVGTQDTLSIEEILGLAQEYHGKNADTAFRPDSSLVGEGHVVLSTANLEAAFKNSAGKKIAVIGGWDTPQQSLGWIPVELAKALNGAGHQIAAWGDAALWMIKDGLCSKEMLLPVIILDPRFGPQQATAALSATGKPDHLSGIYYTGLKGCRDLSIALGLAAGGIRVCIGTPLPLWGSESVRNLLTERLAACGGSLTHFDHQVHAQEIMDWFTA